jgi:hypothetical protein
VVTRKQRADDVLALNGLAVPAIAAEGILDGLNL